MIVGVAINWLLQMGGCGCKVVINDGWVWLEASY